MAEIRLDERLGAIGGDDVSDAPVFVAAEQDALGEDLCPELPAAGLLFDDLETDLARLVAVRHALGAAPAIADLHNPRDLGVELNPCAA